VTLFLSSLPDYLVVKEIELISPEKFIHSYIINYRELLALRLYGFVNYLRAIKLGRIKIHPLCRGWIYRSKFCFPLTASPVDYGVLVTVGVSVFVGVGVGVTVDVEVDVAVGVRVNVGVGVKVALVPAKVKVKVGE
jgi:hypothetical protein